MIRFHRNDLPAEASFGEAAAIDTETLGLNVGRDRLCVVQISAGDGSADIVQIAAGQTRAPNLERLLADPNVVKLFHYGRFDMGILHHAFGVMACPVYCTKIASKIARTYTDRHGLKDLTRELLGVEISKQQQSSDWGAETLNEAQLAYAASDVLYLHALREKLNGMLEREGRSEYARAAFAYLPDRVRLDLAGFEAMDVFSHDYP
jgi:ribonuclease D